MEVHIGYSLRPTTHTESFHKMEKEHEPSQSSQLKLLPKYEHITIKMNLLEDEPRLKGNLGSVRPKALLWLAFLFLFLIFLTLILLFFTNAPSLVSSSDLFSQLNWTLSTNGTTQFHCCRAIDFASYI